MIHLNHPYKCRHCGEPYVILQSWKTWRFIPVNYYEGFNLDTLAYDKEIHTSHFLSCPKLAEQWEQVTKQINKEREMIEKLELKSFIG